MAKFEAELPNDLLKTLESLSNGGADDMMNEMVEKGAKFVYSEVRKNMRKAFKSTKKLERGLFVSRLKHFTDDGGKLYIWIGFGGYVPGSKQTHYVRGMKAKYYPKGTPIPLIALAREYGTSRGEHKHPFLRPAFNKRKITDVMLKVQKKYIPED